MPRMEKYQQDYKYWANQVLKPDYKARHEFRQVGVLPDFVMGNEDVKALKPGNNAIYISDYQLRHSQRTEKSVPLPIDIIKNFPDKLKNSRWFYDSHLKNLTAVFDIGANNNVGKAIVVINFDRKKKTYNAVKTSGAIDISTLGMSNYKELKDEP